MYIKETIQKHTKYKYTYYQNTHTIVKTPTHYKTNTYTHPHCLVYFASELIKCSFVENNWKIQSVNLLVSCCNGIAEELSEPVGLVRQNNNFLVDAYIFCSATLQWDRPLNLFYARLTIYFLRTNYTGSNSYVRFSIFEYVEIL